MKFKKSISLFLAGLMLVGATTGCGNKKPGDGKIEMTVSQWPGETEPERIEMYKAAADEFEKLYPNIDVIEGYTSAYSAENFAIQSNANQLPSFLDPPFTEITNMIESGLVSDITDVLKDNDLFDVLNPDIIALCTDDNGRIYGIPSAVYAMGLLINKDIFEKAGLVNEDGSPKVPQTYQELAEYSQIIKEKTGLVGLSYPISGGTGGWVFMNIAWSFGVEFVEQQSDGSWKAVFDSPQFKKALQYMKDLRWKYNALSDNKLLDAEEFRRLIGTGQAAMGIIAPEVVSNLTRKYGMNKDDVYYARVPAGEAGRYAQLGGGITIFPKGNTPEETDAAVKWVMFRGRTSEITPEVEKTLRQNYQDSININEVVFPMEFLSIWSDPERVKKDKEIRADYANVDMKDYEDYASFEDVIIRPEEPVCAQALYRILGGVIQAVTTDENADIDSLTKTAVNDFQKNHLDNLK